MKDICELCSLCSPTMGCTRLENESCLKEALNHFEPREWISRTEVKEKMIKYGFHAPDMTVTEFMEDFERL